MSAPPARLLFLLRHGPQSRQLGEWLDAVLTFAAFDADIGILMLDAGVLHVQQTPSPDSLMPHGNLLENLRFFGVDALWAEQESLIEQKMPADSLPPDIHCIGRAEVAGFLDDFGRVFGA
jgi:sulfur relay (sulfurtransferase) DsrF/TusC family protein